MYGKSNYQHYNNIVDCVRAKVNRLDNSKIRPNKEGERGEKEMAVEWVLKENGMKVGDILGNPEIRQVRAFLAGLSTRGKDAVEEKYPLVDFLKRNMEESDKVTPIELAELIEQFYHVQSKTNP